MQLEFHQIDAFSDRPFGGNPAVVYRLDGWLADELMQRIAAEHNQAETAFLVREGMVWHIRWFTPTVEVPLCGHGTLAAAHVLFNLYNEPGERIDFICKSGSLSVSREAGRLVLDFPATMPQEVGVNLEIRHAFGPDIVDALATDHLMVVLESEQAVREFVPDYTALAKLPWRLGVIITAKGNRHDFVSRFFAPGIGINEDPVTGSAHCSLVPYWSKRLSKFGLSAYQCSPRGGELICRLEGSRVKIGGTAILVASGKLFLNQGNTLL